MTPSALAMQIKEAGRRLGFDRVAVGPAGPPEHAAAFESWLDAGHAGTMGEGPGEFIAPHGIVMDSHGAFYVAEVAFTAKGRHENPPREIRSLQKFALAHA